MGLRVEHVVACTHSSVLEQASAALLAAAESLTQQCGDGLQVGLQVEHVVECPRGQALEQAHAAPPATAKFLRSTHISTTSSRIQARTTCQTGDIA